MGYRSDVRIITTKKGFNELKKFVNKYEKEKNVKYSLLDNLDVNVDNNFEKYIGWNSLKWYEDIDGYECVNAIMKGLDHLEEDNYSYRYARIGENYDDYDESYFESSKEEERMLEFPSVIREFDDNYTKLLLEENQKEISKNEELNL